MKNKIFSYSKGFTLVELLVVVAIISLLASIVFVSLGGFREDARDTKREADLRQIKTAMELCYFDASCNTSNAYVSVVGPDVPAIPGYIAIPPTDPQNPARKYIWVPNTGTNENQEFCVYVELESGVGWFYASETGIGTTTTKPTTLALCP